jgi:DNA-binding NarL/FixJ family response regulator
VGLRQPFLSRLKFGNEKPLLTDREMEIVQFADQGFHNKEIAEKLFISNIS